MKINKMKAAIGVLATSAVVSLVGSISGTMAWLQYNTRARVEMYGTTAACTENLQIRTVNVKGDLADYHVADTTERDALTSVTNGQIAICDDGKIYKREGGAWDGGTAMQENQQFKVGNKFYKFASSTLSEIADAEAYGEWKTSLTKADIKASAAGQGHDNDNKFSPVTIPGVGAEDELGKVYSHPLCGFEKYDDATPGNRHWKEAADTEYLQFQVQFRVVDTDGEEAGTPNSLLAKNVYFTDITIANDEIVDTGDVKKTESALRIHVSDGDTFNKYFATGDGTSETFLLQTCGKLDLDGDADYDSNVDAAVGNYSFNTDPVTLLNYGKDKAGSVAYDLASATGVLAKVDEVGKLTDGQSLGETKTDETFLTLTITVWLEGWTPLGDYVVEDKGTLQTIVAAPAGVVGQKYFDSSTGKIRTCTSIAPSDVWDEGVAPSVGDIYLDHSDSDKAKYWDGTSWVVVPTIEKKGDLQSVTTEPAGPSAVGDLYYDSTAKKIKSCTAVGAPATWDAGVDPVAGDVYYSVAGTKNIYWDGDSWEDAALPASKGTIWDAAKTIGDGYNIGFSFGIPALEPIQA